MNDLILLAHLLAGPQHGYALKKQTALITGNPPMHNNFVYPLLRHFVAAGWVKQKETAGERGQTRVVYSLTPLGRAELLRRLMKYGAAEARSPEAFQLRVGLFAYLDAAARAEILGMRQSFLEGRDEKLAHLQRAAELGRYGGDVVQFLRKQIRAELDWVGHLRHVSAAPRQKTVRRKRRGGR
jgi:DNA-binding PadR family transcriptional regulator